MRAASFALLGWACCLAGCALGPDPKTDHYLVSNNNAEFFKYGPAQAFGADSALKKGEAVTMLKREFGYSKIQLADGTPGYMATEDLKPAPPTPPPARARSTPDTRRVARRSSHVQPTPSDPLFDVTDIPLPLPESKKP